MIYCIVSIFQPIIGIAIQTQGVITIKLDILYDLTIEKIISVFSLYTEKNKTVKRNNRSCWAIILKYEGETEYLTHDKHIISNFENMVILPKGSSYRWRCTKPGRYYTIEFESKTTCNEIFSINTENGEKIFQIYKDMERRQTIKSPLYKLKNLEKTYEVLLQLLKPIQKKYTPTEKQQKIFVAMDYISNNYNKTIKNDDLAKIVSLSTIYFRKLFTETYGISPIAYIHKLRVKKAKEMLKSDHGSLTDIALSLGYTSIYDFSRVFKKHTGLSPLNYIKEKQSVQVSTT